MLDRLHGLTKEVHVQFEFSAGERLREVILVLQGLDLESGGLLTRERALRLFDFTLELAQGTKVVGDIRTSLLHVLLDKVVDDAVVEILTFEVNGTNRGFDLKDTLLNDQYINISSFEIEDQDVKLTLNLLVKVVRDTSRSRFIDDAKDIKTQDGTDILRCLIMRVIEVCEDDDDGLRHSVFEVILDGLPHFGNDLSRDFLRSSEKETRGHAGRIQIKTKRKNCLVTP